MAGLVAAYVPSKSRPGLVRLAALGAEERLFRRASKHMSREVALAAAGISADFALERLQAFMNPHVLLKATSGRREGFVAVWAAVKSSSYHDNKIH